MPPKFKFTRDEITNAALNVTRKNGISGLTARALAAELGCSVKPIFGLFKNMEEVGQEVFIASDLLYQNYLREDMAKGKYSPYKARLYGIVRHPMYSVTIILFLTMPLMLGSILSFVVFLFYPLIIAKRIKNEEQVLETELDGYADYKKKVKYRLIPYIW